MKIYPRQALLHCVYEMRALVLYFYHDFYLELVARPDALSANPRWGKDMPKSFSTYSRERQQIYKCFVLFFQKYFTIFSLKQFTVLYNNVTHVKSSSLTLGYIKSIYKSKEFLNTNLYNQPKLN